MKALSDNKQTTINLITSLAAFVINAGISFVLTPYILEKLGNEAYGFIGLAYDFVNYAGILTLALNSMSCRFVSYEYHRGNKEKADKQKAVSDIVALENALDMYKLDNHRYPTTNQGLESLVEAPTLPPLAANYNKEGYIKRLPADPWGNDYVLVNPGEHGAYDLLSAGPDGEMGTEDDITNWGLSKKKK